MALTEERKIELASGVLSTLTNRGISIEDRLNILDLAMKSLNAKKRAYNRRKNKPQKKSEDYPNDYWDAEDEKD